MKQEDLYKSIGIEEQDYLSAIKELGLSHKCKEVDIPDEQIKNMTEEELETLANKINELLDLGKENSNL